jgi:hypothetical protein
MYDTVRYGTSIEYDADLSHSAHTVQLYSLLDDQHHKAVQNIDLKNSSEVGLCLLLENDICSTSQRNMSQHMTSNDIISNHVSSNQTTSDRLCSILYYAILDNTSISDMSPTTCGGH